MSLESRIRKFVGAHSHIVDIQFYSWDAVTRSPWFPEYTDLNPLTVEPYPLPLDPFNKNENAKQETSHYFLLVASIDQSGILGKAENARELVARLYEHLGRDCLFEADESTLSRAVQDMRSRWFAFDSKWKEISQAKRSDLIPSILSSVNLFAGNICRGDIVKFSQSFESPADFAEEIATRIFWMGKTPSSTRKKVWMYLRWMVREYPDMHIFNHFHSRDLYVPLDINVGKVAICLGWLPAEKMYSLRWSDVVIVTEQAKKLYRHDPTKIDFPFFLLGRNLPNDMTQLNKETLEKTMKLEAEIEAISEAESKAIEAELGPEFEAQLEAIYPSLKRADYVCKYCGAPCGSMGVCDKCAKKYAGKIDEY